MSPPRSRTSCRSLPPEGAAAPAARQSRFRGPCLLEAPPRAFASRNFPPFALILRQAQDRVRKAYRRVPPERAAAPAARQSRFCGPCWLEEGAAAERLLPRSFTYPFALILRQAQDRVRKAYRRVPPEGAGLAWGGPARRLLALPHAVKKFT